MDEKIYGEVTEVMNMFDEAIIKVIKESIENTRFGGS